MNLVRDGAVEDAGMDTFNALAVQQLRVSFPSSHFRFAASLYLPNIALAFSPRGLRCIQNAVSPPFFFVLFCRGDRHPQ